MEFAASVALQSLCMHAASEGFRCWPWYTAKHSVCRACTCCSLHAGNCCVSTMRAAQLGTSVSVGGGVWCLACCPAALPCCCVYQCCCLVTARNVFIVSLCDMASGKACARPWPASHCENFVAVAQHFLTACWWFESYVETAVTPLHWMWLGVQELV
jgi:hypothetical protein